MIEFLYFSQIGTDTFFVKTQIGETLQKTTRQIESMKTETGIEIETGREVATGTAIRCA